MSTVSDPQQNTTEQSISETGLLPWWMMSSHYGWLCSMYSLTYFKPIHFALPVTIKYWLLLLSCIEENMYYLFKKSNFLHTKTISLAVSQSGTNYFKFTSFIMHVDNGAPPTSQNHAECLLMTMCSGFGWDRVNFPFSSWFGAVLWI